MAQPPERARWIQAALDEHERPLIRYATSIVGCPDQARDVVQDVFVKFCAAQPDDVEGRTAEWLFTVCRNRAIDLLRKERRMIATADPGADAPAAADDPAATAAKHESAQAIWDALDRLPHNQREVIRLKFQGDLSYKEISRVTGLSVTNVGFLLHAGLRRLRALAQTGALDPAS